ncbi:MAG: FAD-dependent oxidoreductase [Sedimentisphaerales bacterium]|nr:FAD-dependent oxidoreductase [Sedimentisphaerales bacterium]
MKDRINRRDCLRMLGYSGLAAGLSGIPGRRLWAQNLGESSGFQSSVISASKIEPRGVNAVFMDGQVIQPQRQLPILDKTDVLVVGGGPAGIVAAIAAKRTGVNVTLVERYGHFGGLWTGGLVLLILGHIVTGGKQVCQGIGEEIMRRLDTMDGAIIDRKPGANPTVDAEAVKYLMVEMIEEAGVRVFLHCWGVDAIMDNRSVRGAVFESKAGRQAILADVVVDATGDGDVFAAAGAEFEHRSHNVGLVSRIGNLDRIDSQKTPEGQKPRRLGNPTPVAGVNWVNLTGPEVDGLDLATLTRMEMNHRKFIWKNMQKTRSIPGYEQVYLMETAPQLGVRITRVLHGLNRIRLDDLKANTKFPDVIGVGGASNAEHKEWQIPYGALVPRKVDHLLAAGRCVSMDIRMADLVRLIPNCFVTGHAAGVAAAVAVQDQCPPRKADITKIQKILKQQDAYLG